jgi:hypothetical protein
MGLAGIAFSSIAVAPRSRLITVTGPIDAQQLGVTLMHEH